MKGAAKSAAFVSTMGVVGDAEAIKGLAGKKNNRLSSQLQDAAASSAGIFGSEHFTKLQEMAKE